MKHHLWGVLVTASSKFIATCVLEFGAIMQATETFCKDRFEDLGRMQQQLIKDEAWDSKTDCSAAEIKDALTCLGALLPLSNSLLGSPSHKVAMEKLSSAQLSEVIALKELATLKPFINTKEAQGDTPVVQGFVQMHKFWTEHVQPGAAQALDQLASVPAESLRAHWQVAVSCLRVVERSVMGAANKPTSDELTAAMTASAAIDANAAADLQALAAAASSSLQTQRCQLLKRVISAVTLLGNVWPVFAVADFDKHRESALVQLSKISQEASSLEQWINGNRDHFGSIDKDWYAQTEESERVLKLLARCCEKGQDTWSLLTF